MGSYKSMYFKERTLEEKFCFIVLGKKTKWLSSGHIKKKTEKENEKSKRKIRQKQEKYKPKCLFNSYEHNNYLRW